VKARLVTFVGAAVAVVCGWFVVGRLVDDWPEVSRAIEGASGGWLALAIVLAGFGMTAIAVGWVAVLERLGHPCPRARVVRWYFAGEIGKYVPGGVWPVVGRAELARRGGLPRAAAYTSVGLSLGLLYLAAAVLACLLLPFGLDAGGPVLLVLLLAPVGLVCLHPAVTRRAEALAGRLLQRPVDVDVPAFGTAVGLVARYLPAWLLIGGATCAVARALDPDAPLARVLFATTVSWLAGFLAVPVPGGVGVREAVFVGLTGPLGGVATATAVIARVVFVVVDAAGAVVSAAWRPRSSTAPGGEPPARRTSG
jgi:uncharacterized membrane protein YbhN (UPF0104 family)